jgi:peptidoglycan/LPS O-acetylase OafA/YrhL
VHAQLAVDFFFLLSGFVLSTGVEQRCHDARTGMRFFAERIGRLWPVMAVASMTGFAVATIAGSPAVGWTTLALALLFVPGRTPRESIFPLNGAQWSLMFELIANAIHALILWRLRTRLLVVLAGISWFAMAAVAYNKGEIAYGPVAPGWQLGVLRVSFAYTLGCSMGRHTGGIARLPRISKAPWWAAVLLLCLILLRPGREQLIDGWWDLMTLLLFPLVLALALGAPPPPALRKPMCIAGAASWPLYALHGPLLNAAKALAEHGVLSESIGAPIAAVLVVALSFMIGPSRLAKGIRLPLSRADRTPFTAALASA